MSVIKVFTDDGKLVDTFEIDDGHSPYSIGQNLVGRHGRIDGSLGRALDDARLIQRGIDPERPSEKVMRLLAERRQA